MAHRELVEVTLKKYNFSFDVARLSEEAILEKLAVISTDTGVISKIEYQNFVFMETIVNLDRVFRFAIETAGDDREEQMQFRNDMESLVYGVNPAFDPVLLVITKNGMIRPVTLGEGVPLVENPGWDKDFEDVDPYIEVEEFDIIDDPEDAPPNISDDGGSSNSKYVKKKWSRTNIVVTIRKFSKENIGDVFRGFSSFPSELIYKAHIIHKCVVDHEHLLLLIESMRITDDVAQEVILDEIFKLCVSVNPFLKFSEIDISSLPRKSTRTGKSVRKRSPKTEVKSDRLFTDVGKEDLLTLADRMKAKVVGQGEAIDQIVETIQIASCGLRNPDKPIAVYMLCGVTGVGKTYSSKVLADELCGSQEAMVRIDCSEYTQQHDIQKLYGSPPSYVGYDDGGFLTNAVMARPFSIVLFDEIEKAHSKLFDVLLQVMDDARLTDGKGNVVSFKDCVILLTSNVGVAESEAVKGTMGFGDDAHLTEDRRNDALKKALKKRFRPEFLNRIDNTISFRSLNKEDAVRVVELLLDKVAGYLQPKNIEVEFTDAVKSMIFDKGFSKKFGARPLERAMEREVIKPIAQKLLREEIKNDSSILVDFIDGQLVIKDKKSKQLKKAQ
jgi:hypothetical protein